MNSLKKYHDIHEWITISNKTASDDVQVHSVGDLVLGNDPDLRSTRFDLPLDLDLAHIVTSDKPAHPGATSASSTRRTTCSSWRTWPSRATAPTRRSTSTTSTTVASC